MNTQATQSLRIGQVMETTFSLFVRNFPMFFLLALIALAPLLVVELFRPPIRIPLPKEPLQNAVLLTEQPTVSHLPPWAAILLILVAVVLLLIVTGAVTYIVIAQLRQSHYSIAAALSAGSRAALPMVGVFIILFSIFLGFALVTGVIWAIVVHGILQNPRSPVGFVIMLAAFVAWIAILTRLSVTTPAIVVERESVFGSMSRSLQLTKGNALRILGALFACFFIVFVINVLVHFGLLLMFGLQAAKSTGLLIAQHILGVAETPFVWILVAVIYYHLRLGEEAAAAAAQAPPHQLNL